MRRDRLPLTYDECRARFRWAVAAAGLPHTAHPLAALGPEGQTLTIDLTWAGADRPERALLVLSGVHGVEGFVTSAMQVDLVERLDRAVLPADMAIVVVHSVNPWGMAWGRRQDDAGVDLNRNWQRSEHDPEANEDYAVVHPLACPDTPGLPDVDTVVAEAMTLAEDWGFDRVRDAITQGQYTHSDGLHYGGAETREANIALEVIARERLAGVQRLFTLDLHTGHGPRGELTLLSDQPPGSDQDRFLREVARPVRVEATVANPDATTGPKRGQIANGIGAFLGPDVTAYATSAEVGTADDMEQLVATYLESWVHRHGDRSDPVHAAAAWRYRCCFTVDDPAWEAAALAGGTALLDRAVASVVAWD